MDDDNEAVEAMKHAIKHRDLATFESLLEQKPQLFASDSKWFPESRRCKDGVTLLLKLTSTEYVDELRSYLQRCWQTISSDDANSSLVWSMNFCSSKQIPRILFEAGIEGKPQYMSSRGLYFSSMALRFYDLAKRAAKMPDFSVTSRMKVLFDGEELRVWDLPLHEAVANHQLAIAEFLFMVKEAPVDSLSFRVTSLMAACHLVLPNAVEGTLPFLKSRAIFYFALFSNLPDVAEKAVRIHTFKVNSRLRLYNLGLPVLAWALPSHDAVAHRQLELVELLLIERGAAVDQQSVELITPLAVACQIISKSLVAQLLWHGANPNVPALFTRRRQRLLADLTRQHCQRRGLVLRLPVDRGSEQSRHLSEKADLILQLLINA